MPAPLKGSRILFLIEAKAGWSAWMKGPDGTFSQQPVVCWAAVETEETDASGMRVLARSQDVVPIVCSGSGGLIDATIPDEALGEYVGVTGPGETPDRIKALVAIDEQDDAEAEAEEKQPSPVRLVTPELIAPQIPETT